MSNTLKKTLSLMTTFAMILTLFSGIAIASDDGESDSVAEAVYLEAKEDEIPERHYDELEVELEIDEEYEFNEDFIGSSEAWEFGEELDDEEFTSVEKIADNEVVMTFEDLTLQDGEELEITVEAMAIKGVDGVEEKKATIDVIDPTEYTVTFDITDEEDEALEGVEIDINDDQITTDEDGEATIDLREGEYDYEADKTGYESKTGDVEVDDIRTVDFSLEKDSEVADLIVHEKPETFVVDEDSEITFALVNEAGDVVEEADEKVDFEFTDVPFGSDIADPASGETEEGKITVEITPDVEDQYRLRAEQENHTARADFEAVEELPGEYDVPFNVVNTDGDALEAAEVELEDVDTKETDEDGKVEFEDVKEGDHDYTVNKEGYGEAEGTVTVEEDMDEELVIMTEVVDYDLVDYSAFASEIRDYDEDTEIGDGEEDGAEIEARFRDRDGSREYGPHKFYVVFSEDSGAINEDKGDVRDVTKINDEEYRVVVDAVNGDFDLFVTSTVPGDIDVDLYKYEDEETSIDGVTIEFESTEDIDAVELEVDEYDEIFDGYKVFDAGDDVELTATALAGNWEVEDEDVEFEKLEYCEDDGWDDDEWDNIGTVETDEDGEAELDYEMNDSGRYKFRAIAEDWDSDEMDDEDVEWDETKVRIRSGDADLIEAERETKYADIEEDEFEVYYNLYDEHGNDIENPSELEVRVTDVDGDRHDEDDDGVTVTWCTDEEALEVEVDMDELDIDEDDREGWWEVRAQKAGTTIRAYTDVKVTEFGEIVDMEIEMDPQIVNFNEYVDEEGDEYEFDADDIMEVTLIDEQGMEIEYEADSDDDIVFSSSRGSVATIDRYDAEVTIKYENTGETTITAYHLDEELEAEDKFYVGDDPEGLEIVTDIEPGEKDGTVTMYMIDQDEYRTADEDDEEYNIISPADISYSDVEDFEDGVATFEIEAEEYEVYDIRVVTERGLTKTFEADFTEEATYEVIFEVFDEEEVAVEDAEIEIANMTEVTDEDGEAVLELEAGEYDYTIAKEDFETYEGTVEVEEDTLETVTLEEGEVRTFITLTEGSETIITDGEVDTMDATPAIINNRTYLPFRAVGEALGADVDWDADDESVTAELDGTTAVFYLDSTTAYVDGDRFDMDVAPELDEDAGRALLPIRFVAEAFDAYVDWDGDTREIEIERIVN
ncbi:stalk domain-containing protein [Natranaerobius thermophilus]|uniref:Copper amine oxidase domain protein n=1 Tax=Natranaerobius thermophilus (strain ATCC BAA-1301 / DSM 18059 / JW/NM-WN-LF) TaxID=457570 RepID=B2A1C1_NATTJ|nr:stalk domain-containing protein [Natranaerobius thermophilus]ACB86059.1 copper amine oxidase domain protein [Natranaerobius thermophilus JW/NM-WN-LF]